MSEYQWEGQSGISDAGVSQLHNVLVGELFVPNFTFIRAIVNIECVHILEPPRDIASLPVWAPVVMGLDWRGRGGADTPRDISDGGGDWSLWRGVHWEQETIPSGAGGSTVIYRNRPENDFINVDGERILAPYCDPVAKLWLQVGYGLAGTPEPGQEIRAFTMAYTIRILYLHT